MEGLLEAKLYEAQQKLDRLGISRFECKAGVRKGGIEVTKPSELSGYIDHSGLKPNLTVKDIERLCGEVREYRFRGICVNPVHVKLADDILDGTDSFVISVCGFPLGMGLAETKVHLAGKVIELGADEIDMVLQIGLLKSGMYKEVFDDIRAVTVAAGNVPVKVILETCLLTEEEKIIASMLVKRAGAAFVKTSTGFSDSGATEDDIRLMRMVVGEDIGVKAAGGVRDFQKACSMIKAGADCIGATASVKMVSE